MRTEHVEEQSEEITVDRKENFAHKIVLLFYIKN